ncbi:hypothetical protein LX32DRAFT_206748 [Colletotrichum zoysiae]|uniref:Uncharacterized protein n=1 Tax=Colletotrichum zoysiae TaxID=1216348 RepID=A0AAD9HQC5_9PEZI|nr:hypothetical protein LX32DRAFT_206748 [Colletotrichum zoysiae]
MHDGHRQVNRIQSLASRSHLLPGLSSVFAALDEIKPGRMQYLIKDGAESQPTEANGHSSEAFWQQLWRLTRARLPSIQSGDLQQRGVHEAAAADDDVLSIKQVEMSAGFMPRYRAFADKAPNLEVGTNIGTCENYNIQDYFSDSAMGQHEDDVDELAPEANDAYRYSSPSSMDAISVQYEVEGEDDDACSVEHSLDHDDEFVSLSSGHISSPPVPFSGEASPECFKAKDLNQTDFDEDRKLSRNSTPVSFPTDSQGSAAHAREHFGNWWSSDVDSGEEQSPTSDNTGGLQERIPTLPHSDHHIIMVASDDAFSESQTATESDAESGSRNDHGSFESSGDAHWEPSKTRWYSTIPLEEIEMEHHSEDEWAV